MSTSNCHHATCQGEFCRRPPKEVKPRVPLRRTAIAKNKPFTPKEGSDGLQAWFEAVRVNLKGRCSHCGEKSCKDDDKYYKFSIAHILPKAYFPSVATNEFNFVELCFWGNNCHGNMDSGMLDLIDMACFDEIVTKFCKMYPSIAPNERRRIPQVLLQYIEIEL